MVWTDFFLGIVSWRTLVRIVMPANPHPRCSDVFDVWLHRKVELDWSVDYGLAMWAAGRNVILLTAPILLMLSLALRDKRFLALLWVKDNSRELPEIIFSSTMER